MIVALSKHHLLLLFKFNSQRVALPPTRLGWASEIRSWHGKTSISISWPITTTSSTTSSLLPGIKSRPESNLTLARPGKLTGSIMRTEDFIRPSTEMTTATHWQKAAEPVGNPPVLTFQAWSGTWVSYTSRGESRVNGTRSRSTRECFGEKCTGIRGSSVSTGDMPRKPATE